MTGAGLSLVFPFCRLHSAFPYAFLNSFLHHLLDFIPLDFSLQATILCDYSYQIALNIKVILAIQTNDVKNECRRVPYAFRIVFPRFER